MYFIFEFCIRITPWAPGSLAVREDFVIASTWPTTGSYLVLSCVVCVFGQKNRRNVLTIKWLQVVLVATAKCCRREN